MLCEGDDSLAAHPCTKTSILKMAMNLGYARALNF